jgi:hypothetical protein
MFTLDPIQIKNCYKVANFLETLSEDDLRMEDFVTRGSRMRPPTCGSVCCVLGWTPAIIDCEHMKGPDGYYIYDQISASIFGVRHNFPAVYKELFGVLLPDDPKEVAQRLRMWAKSGGNTAEFFSMIDEEFCVQCNW